MEKKIFQKKTTNLGPLKNFQDHKRIAFWDTFFKCCMTETGSTKLG